MAGRGIKIGRIVRADVDPPRAGHAQIGIIVSHRKRGAPGIMTKVTSKDLGHPAIHIRRSNSTTLPATSEVLD